MLTSVDLIDETINALNREYEGKIFRLEKVQKVDLDIINHLSGNQKLNYKKEN